jgi:predicted O-methyltransferase YrrM
MKDQKIALVEKKVAINIEKFGTGFRINFPEKLIGEGGPILKNREPYLDGMFGFAGPLIRQIFMASIIWRLAQDFNSSCFRMLEVGSWCGASMLTWANSMSEYDFINGQITCVDAWEPYIDTKINHSEKYRHIETALREGYPLRVFNHNVQFAPDGIIVNAIRGHSAEVLSSLSMNKYNCVYIDGDHSYETVRADIIKSMPLVIDGGILCGDDLEIQEDECSTAVINNYPEIDFYYDTTLDKHFHPGVTRAVGEIFGRVSVWEGVWAMRKQGKIWKPVSLEGMPFYCPPHITGSNLMELKIAVL